MTGLRNAWREVRGSLRREEGSSLKHSTALLISMAGARGTLFCAFLLLLRRMPVGQFGSFFLGYTTLTMVPLLADFGIGQTFIRHIPFYRETRPQYSRYLHWLFFVLKASSVGALVLAAWPAIPLAARFLHLQDQKALLTVAILGAGVTIFYDYVNAVFQITYAFKRFELYLFLRNAVFFLVVLGLIAGSRMLLNPVALVLCIVTINLGLVLTAIPYFSRQWKGRSGRFADFQGNLLRYSKWLTVAAVCFAAYRRIDIYILSHFRSLQEVGVYSAAILLVEPVAMISPALFAVFLPKLSADPAPEKIRRYLGLIACVSLMVVVGVCAYIVAIHLLLPVLGANYRDAFPVTILLLLGTVPLIACNMLCVVFLVSDRPDIFGRIAVALAAFSLIGNWFLIPRFGAMGAAAVYGVSQLVGVALSVLAIRGLLRVGALSDQAMREQTLVGRRITGELAVLLREMDDEKSSFHPAPWRAAQTLSSESML